MQSARKPQPKIGLSTGRTPFEEPREIMYEKPQEKQKPVSWKAQFKFLLGETAAATPRYEPRFD